MTTWASSSGRLWWWRWRCPRWPSLRHTRWEARVIRSAALAILLVGAVLFVERTLL
jgi:hypothetical protein